MPPEKKMINSKKKTCNNDSEQPILVHDVIRSILKRLNFVDFHRARCVSSEWYSASESIYPTYPSLILFPNEQNDDGSCKLYDPRDHSSYTVRGLGFDFARSRCLASSGSWFLMLENRTDLHILNMFTRERLPLPSFRSYVEYYNKAILWVDEKTRDYLVVFDYCVNNYDTSLVYHKKEDNTHSWKVFPPLLPKEFVYDLVFRESKLYMLISSSVTPNIIVFDFSSRDNDSPKECASFPVPVFYHREQYYMNLAVTLSGEILIIASYVERCTGECFFDIYKMDPKSSKWSIIKSIGDQVLLFDLGITVAAKDDVMRNCMYFGNNQPNRIFGKSLSNHNNCICVYDIQTDKVLQWFRRLPVPFKDARWFLPTSGGKCLL